MLLVDLEERLLREDGVGGPRAGARERVLLGHRLQLVERHDGVDEPAVVHLLRAERAAREHHLHEPADAHHRAPLPLPGREAGVAERGMAEECALRRYDDVGIRSLVEVPAIAVAAHLEDAHLLEVLEAAHPRGGVGVELHVRRAVAVRATRRVLHVSILGDADDVLHRDVAPLGHDVHELGEVGTTAEVGAVRANDEHLHVVVEVRMTDEVGVSMLRVDRHGVELVGAIECDRRDLRGRVLLVEDDLHRRGTTLLSCHGARS